MNSMRSVFLFLRAAAIAACLVLLAGPCWGVDKVTLKDGKVLEGTITREVDGYIWLKYDIAGIAREQMFAPSEVNKVERDAAASAAPVSTVPVATAGPAAAPAKSSGTTKGVVITLGDETNGDMVGVYMTAHQLEAAIPELEKLLGTDGSGVVVLRIHSGGGLAIEVQKLSDVIHNEYKKRWRTVAWIDSAISAAAMTAHCLEEVYFTSQGNYGACTMFSGALVAAKGRQLEDVLAQMEKISARGNHNTLIMRAMQIQQPLSVHIDEDGEVHWYGDVTSGDIIVNRPGEILTFNARTAEQVKFSRGTADSIEQLTKEMGYQEIDWLGAPSPETAWRVSKAEKAQMDFRKRVHNDEMRTREYIIDYRSQVAAAQSAPRAERPKFVGRARDTLEKIKAMVKNNPNFSFMAFNMNMEEFKDFVEQQEKLLRDLLR
jgi:hypothetical protein